MYDCRFRPKFTKIIGSNKKRDIELVKAVKVAIPKICAAPHNNDGRLHGLLRGQFKKYIGRNRYRIAYAICEDCRRNKHKALNNCSFCNETGDQTVVFFFAGPKKDRHGDYNY